MKLKLITARGEQMVLTVDTLLEVDGKPFTHVESNPSNEELYADLKVAMLAIAQLGDVVDALAERVNEITKFLSAPNPEQAE